MSEEWNKSELDESAFESLVDTASTKFSEALFSFNSQIFLLLYAGFGAITAPNEMLLFAFSEEDRAWRKVAVVNVSELILNAEKWVKLVNERWLGDSNVSSNLGLTNS